MQYKILEPFQKQKIINEIKLMLFAARDFLKNRNELDKYPNCFPIYDAGGYYGEAFGIIRCLVNLGYGEMGPDNGNGLKGWFNSLQKEVLSEEKEFGLERRYNYYRNLNHLTYKNKITESIWIEICAYEIKNILNALKDFDDLFKKINQEFLEIETPLIIGDIEKNNFEEAIENQNMILNFDFKEQQEISEVDNDTVKNSKDMSDQKYNLQWRYTALLLSNLVTKDLLQEGNYIVIP